MNTQANMSRTVSIGRHSRNCRVCAHKYREDIEWEFTHWTGPNAIAKEFGLKDRASVYRHAHAFGLFKKRRRNLRFALEKIIERAGEVEVTAAAVVAAVQACAKINSEGQFIEPSESTSIHDLFDKMTEVELEEYAKAGTLPSWFGRTESATWNDSHEG